MLTDIYDRLNPTDKDAEINIAPLVDMVFILLIFFIVTTSFVKDTGIPINKASASTAEVLERDNLVITISLDDEVFLADEQVSLVELGPLLRQRLHRVSDKPIVIIADRDSRHATLVDVIDECKSAGAESISIAAEVE